jgi:hypothetical protein
MPILTLGLCHVFNSYIEDLDGLDLSALAGDITLLAHDVVVDRVKLQQWRYKRFIHDSIISNKVNGVKGSRRYEKKPPTLKVFYFTCASFVEEAILESF